jgi:hypothetical protein
VTAGRFFRFRRRSLQRLPARDSDVPAGASAVAYSRSEAPVTAAPAGSETLNLTYDRDRPDTTKRLVPWPVAGADASATASNVRVAATAVAEGMSSQAVRAASTSFTSSPFLTIVAPRSGV